MRHPALVILVVACGCSTRALPAGSGGIGYPVDMTRGARSSQEGGPPPYDLSIPVGDPDLGNTQAHGVLLFGGYWPHGYLNDTWLWDGGRWTVLATHNPPALSNSSAASSASGVLLFDGDSTWMWNRSDWTEVSNSSNGGPSPRWRAAMARQGANVILYGGEIPSSPVTVVFNDAWQWNGYGWTQLPSLPIASADMGGWTCGAMASHGSDVVVPGAPTWQWDGAQWTQSTGPALLQPTQCVAAELPGGRVLLLVAAGACAPLQTWVWDGGSWTQLRIAGPPFRTDTAIATEPNGKVLLFGGSDCYGSFLGDTWEFDGTQWTSLDVFGPSARYGAAMAGF